MKIKGKQITFPKSDLIRWSGKLIKEKDHEIVLEGEDVESFVKIYTPFRGVAKLIIYENGARVDAETLSSISDFDLERKKAIK